MNVRLIAVTQPDPEACPQAYADPKIKPWEALMVYAARVSSPKSQAEGQNPERLLRYCLKNGHLSVFEQAHLTLEITTSRAISAQILRHRSFTFQEFSQRYAEAQGFEWYKPRRQDTKNRQASIDNLPEKTKIWFELAQRDIQESSNLYYEKALELGIAKECARFLLPMSTRTKLYMCGSVRSWLNYFPVRRNRATTQVEHADIADAAWSIFTEQFSVTAEAMSEIQDR